MSAIETAPAPLKVSVRQAAAALNISLAYAYRLIDNGELRAVLDGDKRYVLVEELERYVQALTRVQPTHTKPRPPAKTQGRPRKAAIA